MTASAPAVRTPPRFVIRTFWVLHRAAYRLSGGRVGLSRPRVGEKFGMLRLDTVGRRTGHRHYSLVSRAIAVEDGSFTFHARPRSSRPRMTQ